MRLQQKTTFFAVGSVLIALVLVSTVLHPAGATDLSAPMAGEVSGGGDDPLVVDHAQETGIPGTDVPDHAALMGAGSGVSDALEGFDFERGRVEIEQVIDLSGSEMAPLPASSTGIGPGSRLVVTIPNEGTFGCTANFVWED